MEYKLSKSREVKRKAYENKIKENDKKYWKLAEEMRRIKSSKDMTPEDRQIAILKLEIEQKEIEIDMQTQEMSIEKLCEQEMKDNWNNKTKNSRKDNKEVISAAEYTQGTKEITETYVMYGESKELESIDIEKLIIEMKIKLETIKRNYGKIPKDQADENIEKMKRELSDLGEHKKVQEDLLAKDYFEYNKRHLYKKRSNGKISNDELNKQLEKIKKSKEVPTPEELSEMIEKLKEKHLEQPQQIQEYQREVSSRNGFDISYDWEQYENKNINEWHENLVYHNVQDFDNKTFKYGLEAPSDTTEHYLGYIGEKLGEEYARGAKGEKAQLSKQFAMLEVKGRMGDFLDIYNSEQTSGYDNPKLLLQLEKVNGLNIEEFEDAIGLDTSALHQDIFVATYEIEEWDYVLKKNVMKPIKEYYQRDENGDFDIIGTGTENKTTFVIDGVQLDVGTEQVLQGNTLEKVTQKEMSDRLIKNGIEDSLKNVNVTEVAKLTDDSFLSDFREQCGIPDDWDLNGRTFIISTINEKGEEDFDIIIRNDGAGDTEYEHLMGIQATGKSEREMYTTTGRQIAGGLKELDKTKSLKEFVTKSGHRYAITRNAEGKLGFNEIFREKDNIIQAEHVDTYTYSTDDLVQKYKDTEINEQDLGEAYSTIDRTKKEKEETRDDNEYRGGKE